MKRSEIIQELEAFAADADAARARDAIVAAIALLKSDAQLPAVRVRDRLPSAWAPWTREEDERLCQEFDAGRTTAQIALQHGRTSGAIQSRLVKLGRVQPPAIKTSA